MLLVCVSIWRAVLMVNISVLSILQIVCSMKWVATEFWPVLRRNRGVVLSCHCDYLLLRMVVSFWGFASRTHLSVLILRCRLIDQKLDIFFSFISHTMPFSVHDNCLNNIIAIFIIILFISIVICLLHSDNIIL